MTKTISYLFHPILFPSYILLYLFHSNIIEGFNGYSSAENNIINLSFFAISILFSLILPLLFMVLLKKIGKIESYHIEKREERILPFTFTGLSIFCSYYLSFVYFQLPLHILLQVFTMGCLIAITFAMSITLFWKVSIHMMGIGGFTGVLFILSMYFNQILLIEIIISLLLAGLIAYSRLSLKAHSIAQIIAGFFVGFLSEIIFLKEYF